MAYGNISAIGKCTLGTNVTMPNNVALMDDNNIIMLCDDMTLTGNHSASDILLTLPDPAMFPSVPLKLLGLCQQTGGGHLTRVFFIDTQGNLRCNIPVNGIYYLNGFMWHNNGRYYSQNIGNIGGFTKPLSAR